MGELGCCVDLTCLKSWATLGDYEKLCLDAIANREIVRAVCIPPVLEIISYCKGFSPSMVPICAVVDFPEGWSGLAKISEAQIMKETGVNEVDTVLNARLIMSAVKHPEMKETFYDLLVAELKSVTSKFPGRTKVILETGHEFWTKELIQEAVRLVGRAGVFCVKTSTGVIDNIPRAGIPLEVKVQHVAWMWEAITRDNLGLAIKVAGGIKTMKDARLFMDLGIPPEKLIFGASEKFWEKEE